MKIGKSPQGKWLLLEGKEIIKSFDSKDEAIEALSFLQAPKVHKHGPGKYWHHYRDYEHITLGYTCDCGEAVIEEIIGHALIFSGGKWYNGLGEPAMPIPEKYWS